MARFVEPESAELGVGAISRRKWVIAAGATVAVTGGALMVTSRRPAKALAILNTAEAAPRGGGGPEAEALSRSLANALGLEGIESRPLAEVRTLGSRAAGSFYYVNALAGRCWEDGTRVRLMAELREASGELALWSGSWDGEGGKAGAARQPGCTRHLPGH